MRFQTACRSVILDDPAQSFGILSAAQPFTIWDQGLIISYLSAANRVNDTIENGNLSLIFLQMNLAR